MIKAIVAVDKKWGIGKNNDPLFHLPEDMKFFRATTLGKVVVMGSNTLLSFPGGNPLKNRTNVVLWPGGEKREDCIIVGSIDELKDVLKAYKDEEIFVIGGAMFYRTMLPYCESVLVTKVDADGEAQVFFENLDEMDNWSMTNCSESVKSGEIDIRFTTYTNSAPVNFFD
jgi:dihydrofolate reductase